MRWVARATGPNDSNYANGLDTLRHWFEWLSGVEAPETPDTLTVSTGELPQDPPADSDCHAHFNPREYRLDVASGALSWSSCETDAETGGYVSTTNGRVLDAAELESVLAAYHELELGATGSCASLEAPDYLSASVVMNGTLGLFDEVASCSGGVWGGFAIGVAALARLVDELAG